MFLVTCSGTGLFGRGRFRAGAARPERLFDDGHLLIGAALAAAGGGRTARRTADALEPHIELRLQLCEDVRPRAHVARLLLHPQEALGLGVLPQRRLDRVHGQRVQLLHAQQRSVGDALRFAVLNWAALAACQRLGFLFRPPHV